MLAEKLNSLLDQFKTKYPSLVGIDISSTALKLVELSETGKGTYRLERYAIEPLVRDVVADGNIANLDLVSDALKRAHKRLGTRNRNAALALPSAMVITKKIIVPAGQKEEDLELLVEAEANQYIPFALEEVNLDFQIVGPSIGFVVGLVLIRLLGQSAEWPLVQCCVRLPPCMLLPTPTSREKQRNRLVTP